MRPTLGLTEGSLNSEKRLLVTSQNGPPEPKVVPTGTQGTPLDTPMPWSLCDSQMWDSEHMETVISVRSVART